MVTEKDEWTGFIIFMLDGVRDTSLSTIVKIHSMVRLFEESLDKAKKELPGHIYSKELIEAIFRQPYCRIQFLVESGIAKRQTASIYLRELEKIGMLSSDTRGRERIYKNSKLIAAISN
jgi:Fic family protein